MASVNTTVLTAGTRSALETLLQLSQTHLQPPKPFPQEWLVLPLYLRDLTCLPAGSPIYGWLAEIEAFLARLLNVDKLTVLLGTRKASQMIFIPSSRSMPPHSLMVKVYREFLVSESTVNCGTLHKQVCAFLNHVQSTESATCSGSDNQS